MATCFPELVGHRSRGADAPPPVFPDTCPKCGAGRTDDPSVRIPGPGYRVYGNTDRIGPPELAGTWWATYACGGYYRHKPQIQNHTEYFSGLCPVAPAPVAFGDVP